MTPVIVDERKRGPGPHGLPPTVYLNDKSCPLDLVLERLVLPTIVWLFLTYAAWWEEGRGKGSRFTKVDEMSPRVRHHHQHSDVRYHNVNSTILRYNVTFSSDVVRLGCLPIAF